jgi:hypothetical protein
VTSYTHTNPVNAPDARRRWARGWTLERVLFAFAGVMTLASAALAAAVSPWFLLLTAFVAVNQLLFASIGDCGASYLLRRFAHLTAANDG